MWTTLFLAMSSLSVVAMVVAMDRGCNFIPADENVPTKEKDHVHRMQAPRDIHTPSRALSPVYGRHPRRSG